MDLLHDRAAISLVLVLALAISGAGTFERPGQTNVLAVDLGDLDSVFPNHCLDGRVSTLAVATEEARIRAGVHSHDSARLVPKGTRSLV